MDYLFLAQHPYHLLLAFQRCQKRFPESGPSHGSGLDFSVRCGGWKRRNLQSVGRSAGVFQRILKNHLLQTDTGGYSCVRLRSMVAGFLCPVSEVPDLHSSSSANSCVNSTPYNKPLLPGLYGVAAFVFLTKS